MMGRKDLKCKTYEALLKLNRGRKHKQKRMQCVHTYTHKQRRQKCRSTDTWGKSTSVKLLKQLLYSNKSEIVQALKCSQSKTLKISLKDNSTKYFFQR